MPITQISGPAVAIDGGVSLGAPLTIGTNDAQPLIFETSGTERARFTATGEFIVVGSITTINSTVVDIADRVFTVNKSAGANDPVPALMTGLSVYRGAVMGVARDKSVIIWDEPNSRWNFALNTGADEVTIGADQSVKLASLLASGNIRQLTNNSTISGRNVAGMADIEIARVNASDEVNIAAGGANTVIGGGSLRWEGDADKSLTLHSHGTGHAEMHTQTGDLSLETTTGQIEIATTNHSRTILIGTGGGMSQQVVTVGSPANGSSLTLDSGTGAINIGASASARTVNIATGAAQQAVTIGSTASGSTLTLDAASAVSIATSNTARTVNIATGSAAQNVTIGSATGASGMTLRCGSSPFSISTASNSGFDVTYGTNGALLQQQAGTGGTPFGFNTTFGAHAGLSNTEFNDVNFNFARTAQFSGGGAAIAAQRAMRIQAPTYSAAAAQTINRAATVEISGAPVQGSNVTYGAISAAGNGAYALNVASGAARFGGAVYMHDAATPATGGLYVTDSSGNGYRLYQYAANTAWLDTVGSSTQFMISGSLILRANLVSISDGSIDIGSASQRFRDAFIQRTNIRAHAAFTGSQSITSTGAIQTVAAGAANIFSVATLLDNSATMVEVSVIGRATAGADRAFAVRRAHITRQAGGAAALVAATQTIGTDSLPAGYAVDIVVSGNGFNVTVNTGAAVTCNWTCSVRYQTVSGNT